MVAALAALVSLFPVIHLVVGLLAVTGRLGESGGPEERGGMLVGWFFIGFASLFILTGLTFSGFVVAAGRFLQERRNYMFCLVVAGVMCIFAPFGTVLGVLTIVVLMRESVRELFGQSSSTSAEAETGA